MPAFFRDRYLSPENEPARRSGLPADLARDLDALAPISQRLSLSGTVMHCTNPKALADGVGHVSTSIVPAVLDEIVRRLGGPERRDDGLRSSYFVDMFAVLDLQHGRAALAACGPLARSLLADALYDHFAELSRTFGDGGTAGLDEEIETLLDECAPVIELFDVTLHFAAKRAARGARLLGYLFDARPPSLSPAPWPRAIRL